MTQIKVSKAFSSSVYTDTKLCIKANHITTKMTDNPNYTTPSPALTLISTASDNLLKAINKALNGTKEDTVIKNNLRTILEELLRQESDYVQQASGGDEAVILSSGFDVTRKPSTIGTLDKPTGFTIKIGENKGIVIASCDVVKDAAFYEFAYTKAPATATSVWVSKSSTRRKTSISGLNSGEQMVFRAAGAGSDPSRVWSDEITTYVV
jgi:hypothetical protein